MYYINRSRSRGNPDCLLQIQPKILHPNLSSQPQRTVCLAEHTYTRAERKPIRGSSHQPTHRNSHSPQRNRPSFFRTMSDPTHPTTPSEALSNNGAWREDTTYPNPMDGPLDFDFDFDASLDPSVDLFGDTTIEGGRSDVQITDQNISPVTEPLSSGDGLFGETNGGAQAGVQSPAQSITEWAGPSPGAYNSSHAEQAQEIVAGGTTEPSGLISMGPQETVPAFPVPPASTTSQPQLVPDSAQGYWDSLLNGIANTAGTMAPGNAQALGGLAADRSGDAKIDLQNFVEGLDPYPWAPLQENYRGLDLTSETAMGSSFTDSANFASSGIQQSAGYTALNPMLPAPATHPNLDHAGAAMWGTPQVNYGNPANPDMTTASWAPQTAVSAPPGSLYPIRAPSPSFAPLGAAVSKASGLDPSLIDPRLMDPDTVKEFNDTLGAMALGGTAAPQPAFAPTPARSGTMPRLTAPMAPPAVRTRPIPERISARAQTDRHWRSIPEVQSPAQGTVPPSPASHADAAAWDDIEPRKRTVLVHQRGAMEVRPSEIYRPLKAIPRAWGPSMFKKLFTYTEHGEWNPTLRLAHKDLMFYIVNARAHAKRPLKIWIQHCPSQRNYRYPNPHSSKCRWDECPANNNTILKGFYRVAFDEWSNVSGNVTDPFHNAGYMHLHCFEKMFDLFELIKYGYAELENRDFPHEDQNPMSVVEGHPQLTKTFRDWCYDHAAAYETFQQEKARGGPQSRKIPKKQRLWFALTDRYVKLESEARMKMRAIRNGNSLDKHLGDLDSFVHAVRKRKAVAKQARIRAWEEFESDASEPEEYDARVKRPRLGKVPARMRVKEELHSDESEPEQYDARAKKARPGKARAQKRAREEFDSEGSEPEQHDARAKRTRLGKAPARMKVEEGPDSDESEPEQYYPGAKRARLSKARAKRRVVVELDSDDSELEEKISRIKRAHRASLAARKRAVEAVDDGELRSGEDPPRVKCSPGGDHQVRSPSPALSHITVQSSDEEEVGPANEDPSDSSDEGEFEYENGYPVHGTQPPAQSLSPVE